ncbi:hypothetical protein [Glycomyces terrestris]|uniref:Uncharacterized protein n=1 Tax=Glycomyces terrestris TaxID=2493553 RepID=A0A426V0S8_9ACTN|nr:hypothetical protein [Glycomyces terrestris]RRS00415.1 hypothetical protein EIW28_07555 [Glycomyces terrestris]
MGAEKAKQQHPLLAAVLLAIVVLIFLAFPIALYANVMAMVDGYRAAHGQAGTPGTATVLSEYDGRGEQVCTGVFTPDDGGPAVETRIEAAGRCEVGQEVEAHLMPGRPSIFIGYDIPRAWAAGSADWAQYLPLVILFGLLTLPLVLLVAMIVTKLVKLLLHGRAAPQL